MKNQRMPPDPVRSSVHPVTNLATRVLFAACLAGLPFTLGADETCMSPYMAKITGQEEYV